MLSPITKISSKDLHSKDYETSDLPKIAEPFQTFGEINCFKAKVLKDSAADCTIISCKFVEQFGLLVYDFHRDFPSLHLTNYARTQTVICRWTKSELTFNKREFSSKAYIMDESLNPYHLVIAKLI